MTDKLFVVWWVYQANFTEPQFVTAPNAKDAWNKTFPQYVNNSVATAVHEGEFHKYAVEIQDATKFTELTA